MMPAAILRQTLLPTTTTLVTCPIAGSGTADLSQVFTTLNAIHCTWHSDQARGSLIPALGPHDGAPLPCPTTGLLTTCALWGAPPLELTTP